jgi:AAA15 family ATPase/GTPase
MKQKVNHLEINNFKSIKHLQMNCKRLNVFIGEPNVGKSNILEALALLGGHYSDNYEKYLSDLIRYEQVSNLFYDDDLHLTVQVKADDISAVLRHQNNQIDSTEYFIGGKWVDDILAMRGNTSNTYSNKFYELADKDSSLIDNGIFPFYGSIEKSGRFDLRGTSGRDSFFRKYDYIKTNFSADKFHLYLKPPHGVNLFQIIMNNSDLKKEIGTIFKQRGLEVAFSRNENTIELQKRDDDNYVFKYPFSTTADTFQRLIFYLAVIETNKNSVLILEEPEVHSFPPYTTMLTERILDDADNQYFIATHSPYLLGKLVEKADFSELNVCITYFENHQTKVKILNEAELQDVVDYGTDLFFNLSKFIGK